MLDNSYAIAETHQENIARQDAELAMEHRAAALSAAFYDGLDEDELGLEPNGEEF